MRHAYLFAIFLVIALAVAATESAQAQSPLIQQAELLAPYGGAYDWFGNSVALSGSTAVVGALCYPFSRPEHCGPGAAFVFVQNGDGTWSQQAELTASDGLNEDLFGASVAISGGTIVIGAPCHPYSDGCSVPEAGPGAAYVFVQNGDGTWSQQAELLASDGVSGAFLGSSVAVSGSTALVGADGDGWGAAYVFVQSGTTWSQQAKLTASDAGPPGIFGYSVAISGGTALVGSVGAAYVFGESGGTWSQQQELTVSDGANVGSSVAISGGTALVAIASTIRSGGVVYVFGESGGTWSQQAELTASDGQSDDGFGSSVAVSGTTVVVGAPGHTVPKHGKQGVAYVFAQSGTTWTQQTEATAAEGVPGGSLGSSVAVSGSTIVAGAPGVERHMGAAYVFVPGTSTVSLSQASLSFRNEPVNNSSAAKTVTLENTGQGTVDISNISVSTNFTVASTTCGIVLFPGVTCTVRVTFTPTQLGALTGTLTFTDDAQDSPQTVALSGTGSVDATLIPASAIYAAEDVGLTSKAKTFTLRNDQPVELTSIAISTTGNFAVSGTTCGASLGAKSTCAIYVTFTPTATGPQTGQLIVSDSASNSPQTSNLTGTGKK